MREETEQWLNRVCMGLHTQHATAAERLAMLVAPTIARARQRTILHISSPTRQQMSRTLGQGDRGLPLRARRQRSV